MAHSIMNRCFLCVLLCGALSPLVAQETGEAVRIQGIITDDVYAAGGTVDILAAVEGDAVLAAGALRWGNASMAMSWQLAAS